ncbi:MAG: fatty acid desaturase [Deltaproteobacteria bacterium]|nr:fatty acid desaturase [Deltaproteobacteria bacterium]
MPDSAVAKRPIIWLNVAYIVLVPLIVVPASIWYLATHGITWLEFVVASAMWWATGLSITAGYHRLFSHKGYKGSPGVRFFYAVFGAMAGQNSVIAWASDHRYHHQHTDTDQDPYNAKEGFWYSHIGWILRGSVWGETYDNVDDLRRDPILAWQHKYWLAIAVVGNVLCILPLALMTSRPLGMILLAGFLRVTVVQHFTFFINSFAHIWGSQPWSPKTTSRDNWFLSFLTFGEGFHNFHHTFEADYRNGVRWFHWDPSKWLIWSLSRLRLASGLRRTPDWILLRALHENRRAGLVERFQGWSEEKRAEWRRRQDTFAANKGELQAALQRELDAAEERVQQRIGELKARSQEWARMKRRTWDEGSRELREAAELEMRELEFALVEARRAARTAVRRWDRLAREYVDQFGLPDLSLPSPTTP